MSEPVKLPAPNEPMAVARVIANELFMRNKIPTLRHWRGGWWGWQQSHWREQELRAIKAQAYRFTEHAVYDKKTPDGDTITEPWAPTRSKIGDLLEALGAICHLSDHVAQPSWIDGRDHGVIVACGNGLLDVTRRELYSHTPEFFNQVAVPFDYEPRAAPPRLWLKFLNTLWGNDPDSVAVLQEWFGYVISGQTTLQKMLLVVGPTRGGKGTIARLLAALIGPQNVAGPTLSSLAGEFGLAPLIGKPLAVISDARLNGRDSNQVVERLLSVSGQDRLTVNIKYREQWTGTLPSRFMLLSNELPQLGDASAAIAGRFVTLLLERSWLGREDDRLEPGLHTELAGIFNWSLDGLERLAVNRRFTETFAAEEAYRALVDLASPVKAFIRECCVVGSDQEVSVDELYSAWKLWAEDNGHGRKTKQTLGRDLRAALPRLRVERPRDGVDRVRVYQGVALKEPVQEPLS
jgi:putative DNA primase/helicase